MLQASAGWFALLDKGCCLKASDLESGGVGRLDSLALSTTHSHPRSFTALPSLTPLAPSAKTCLPTIGNDKNQQDHASRGSSQETPPERKQLWEVNEIMLLDNYLRLTTEDGLTYFRLSTDRPDLPVGFLHREWYVPYSIHEYGSDRPIRTIAQTKREQDEKQAQSSGRSAQQTRRAGGSWDPNYQLPSHRIANNPNMAMLTSSAENARSRRKKDQD